MGTRHLISVKIDGATKVAQYGQWDGYLEGQGQEIVNFLSGLSRADMEQFKANVRECKFISEDEVQAKITEVTGSDDGWLTLPQSDAFLKAHPEHHRDTGSGILALILEKPRELKDSSEFATDGLFCEYAYVIDLSREILEIYTGGRNLLTEIPFHTLKVDFEELLKLEEMEADN